MNKAEAERSQRKALGKGLSALLPGKNGQAAAPESARAPVAVLPEKFERFESVPVDKIRPGQGQPRLNFEADRLEELAQSIKVHGVLQPITVTRQEDGNYRLVAGERRWRAAKMAGLDEIPALVRRIPNNELLEIALIENIQREDLNPIETAVAFTRLIDEHGLSHEKVAERTGKDRSTVTNFLRLLKLDGQVQTDLIRGDISMGHARALLALSDAGAQRQMAQRIIDSRLSVRETERRVKEAIEGKPERKAAKAGPQVDANTRAAIEEMRSALGTKVRILPKTPSTGKIEIEYYSNDDLDRIYAAIVH